MDKLHLEIVTPEKVIFTEDVDMVIVPGSEGELGILPHHIPIFTKIKPGEMKIKNGDKEEFIAITGGFLNFADQKATILADYAVRSEEIEVAQVEAARKRAEEAMKEKKSESDFAVAEAELRKAILQLQVAERRKRSRV